MAKTNIKPVVEIPLVIAAYALVLAEHHLGDRDELGELGRAVYQALTERHIERPPEPRYPA